MLAVELALPAFLIGVLFLYKGSDILVDGTVKTAAKLGISSLVISVVLVGFGTSSPEFAISFGAAIQQNSDISLGNIIGSCIANILLVLGISAIIRPIQIQNSIIRREAPITLSATLLLLILTYLSFLDEYHIGGGIIFLVAFFIFIWFFVRCAQKERLTQKFTQPAGPLKKHLLFVFLGIAGVVGGAWLLIESSISIAVFLGISPFVIALSLVAVGTSLPELVVSAVASRRGESDIAVGNVLGSNVFNICLILGLAALYIPLQALASIDEILILTGVMLVLFALLYSGRVISRLEGVFLLVLYGVFLLFIFGF